MLDAWMLVVFRRSLIMLLRMDVLKMDIFNVDVFNVDAIAARLRRAFRVVDASAGACCCDPGSLAAAWSDHWPVVIWEQPLCRHWLSLILRS